jgi:hypothetical protein
MRAQQAAPLREELRAAAAIKVFWGSNMYEIWVKDIVDGNPIPTYMSTWVVMELRAPDEPQV